MSKIFIFPLDNILFQDKPNKKKEIIFLLNILGTYSIDGTY